MSGPQSKDRAAALAESVGLDAADFARHQRSDAAVARPDGAVERENAPQAVSRGLRGVRQLVADAINSTANPLAPSSPTTLDEDAEIPTRSEAGTSSAAAPSHAGRR